MFGAGHEAALCCGAPCIGHAPLLLVLKLKHWRWASSLRWYLVVYAIGRTSCISGQGKDPPSSSYLLLVPSPIVVHVCKVSGQGGRLIAGQPKKDQCAWPQAEGPRQVPSQGTWWVRPRTPTGRLRRLWGWLRVRSLPSTWLMHARAVHQQANGTHVGVLLLGTC